MPECRTYQRTTANIQLSCKLWSWLMFLCRCLWLWSVVEESSKLNLFQFLIQSYHSKQCEHTDLMACSLVQPAECTFVSWQKTVIMLSHFLLLSVDVHRAFRDMKSSTHTYWVTSEPARYGPDGMDGMMFALPTAGGFSHTNIVKCNCPLIGIQPLFYHLYLYYLSRSMVCKWSGKRHMIYTTKRSGPHNHNGAKKNVSNNLSHLSQFQLLQYDDSQW